jgi:uncharacterized protein (TIGR03790 family)
MGFRAALAALTAAELILAAGVVHGQSLSNVLVVVNENSAESRGIGDYYIHRRGIPAVNLCRLHTTAGQDIHRDTYDREIAGPIAQYLRKNGMVDRVLYIVTTAGVPLRIEGSSGIGGNQASVDSELAALYFDLTTGKPHPVDGSLENPYFGKTRARFSHPEFPLYLVTRLEAYDTETVKRIVDQSLRAENRGRFVIDLGDESNGPGNNWLRSAALHLPSNRLVFDNSTKVVYNQTDVIGYASWGSNDKNRHNRFLGFRWLPGAIMTEFVSTNARTFKRPPSDWTIADWGSKDHLFFGSPQSLTADYIAEGATGASGHVYEPYLAMTPRPDFLLPAYYEGHNLAESYYLAIPRLSWQNVVVGDPLCTIGKP